MDSDLKEYLNGAEWHIAELGWDASRQNVEESIFNLGNGYLGTRGVLEELPKNSMPGTYFSGLYDNTCAQVKELINAPNPISLHVAIGGEKLGVSAMDVLDHERILDLSQGLLYRRTVFQAAITKGKILYQSLRFVSMANPHLIAMQVIVTPLDHTTTFTVKSSVDTSVTNSGMVTEGYKRHFLIHEYATSGHAKYVCTRSLERETLLGYASQLNFKLDGRTKAGRRKMDDLTVKKGQSLTLTKYFSLYTSNDVPPSKVKSYSLSSLKRFMATGFDKLLERHASAWEKLWQKSDIKIEGDPELQRAVRYNIYNLMSSGSPNIPDDVSIGARCLSGEGYRGHVFWDVEMFLFPFYVFTFPDIARKLLMYRYRRLDASRMNAKERGYAGAMFSWESAVTGHDVTPTWHKDFDGRIIKVHTMDREHHITADIAFAVWQYYRATDDEKFFLNNGLEILLETARFWESRMTYDKKHRRYVIDDIMGPDEFHDKVNNNAFTNVMARWNLLIAEKAFQIGLKKSPKKVGSLIKRLGISQQQIERWHKVADALYIPYAKKGKLIEQHDGYLKKKKYPLPDCDVMGLPTLPHQISLEKIASTQFVKQADVVLLLYLFPSLFEKKFIRENFEFYEARTLHKSSLSAPTHASVAARLNLTEKAYRYLQISARSDLDNVYGNTGEGIHAAALGGTWQVMVKGFCGLQITKGLLTFSPPDLPLHWQSVSCHICWQGGGVDLFVEQKEFRLRWKEPTTKAKKRAAPLKVYVYGTAEELKSGKWYSFPKTGHHLSICDMKGLF